MVDCQYLPMVKQGDKGYKSIHEEVVFNKIQSKSWLDKDVPLFLPPPIFSRIDKPIEYAYRDTPKHRDGYTDPSVNRDSKLIGASKLNSQEHSYEYTCSVKNVM